MSRFIELKENGGVFAVLGIEPDGFARIHRTLLIELLSAAECDYEEVN